LCKKSFPLACRARRRRRRRRRRSSTGGPGQTELSVSKACEKVLGLTSVQGEKEEEEEEAEEQHGRVRLLGPGFISALNCD
jgi:hypothetical protein